VPGRSGRGVSIRCGRLVATELGLSATTVRRGGAVTAGARVGTLGPAGRLRLGARVATDRHGYLDPLALMGDEHAPVAPPPAVRGHRRTRVTGVPRVAPLAPAAASGPDATPPLPVLAGAALVAAAAGGGGAVRARRRRRRARRTEMATVQR
jgi:hypothetical protein